MTVYPTTIIPPSAKLQLVDPKTGMLTVPGIQLLQQIWSQLVPTTQLISCTATNTTNDYILTIFPVPPTASVQKYVDYLGFVFVSPFTSTGNCTANVSGLGDKKVYKSNGAAQAAAGDIVINSLYLLFYNSNLDSASGGFVLK